MAIAKIDIYKEPIGLRVTVEEERSVGVSVEMVRAQIILPPGSVEKLIAMLAASLNAKEYNASLEKNYSGSKVLARECTANELG